VATAEDYQSQDEELSLDAIPTLPAVAMEVPDTPVSTSWCLAHVIS